MKRIVTTMLCGFYLSCAVAQHVSGQYITDGHWDLKKNVNWVNLLRLNLSITLGKGSVEAATIHVAQTDHSVIGDWQGFCNIDAENTLAAIAVLGYMHQWDNAHLFAGVRNCQRRLLYLRRHSPLHQQLMRHLSHDCRQLSYCQLPLVGTHPLFRRDKRRMDLPQQPV